LLFVQAGPEQIKSVQFDAVFGLVAYGRANDLGRLVPLAAQHMPIGYEVEILKQFEPFALDGLVGALPHGVSLLTLARPFMELAEELGRLDHVFGEGVG
jgi:hypothetical protein